MSAFFSGNNVLEAEDEKVFRPFFFATVEDLLVNQSDQCCTANL